MSIGNTKTNGNKGNNFPYQHAVLELLGQINSSIGAIPGVDYETRTTTYQATAAGPGYSIGDIIVRYDIIDVATSTLLSTIWFNQTTQLVIAPPAPASLTPYLPPGNVTVTNPFNLEATQLLVLAALNTITGDTSNLDVALSTRASSIDIVALAAAITGALTPKATTLDIATIVAALGPKSTTADITALAALVATETTLAAFSTKYTAVSRTPSVVNVPASSAGSTTAGVQELSILVIGGGNTVGGVAIPSGTILNYKAKAGDTIAALAYTTGGGANRLILTYLT